MSDCPPPAATVERDGEALVLRADLRAANLWDLRLALFAWTREAYRALDAARNAEAAR